MVGHGRPAGAARPLPLAAGRELRGRRDGRHCRAASRPGPRLVGRLRARRGSAGAAPRPPCAGAIAGAAAIGIGMGRSGAVDRRRRGARAGATHAPALTSRGSLPRIVLASTSPRRIDILTRSGIAFRAVARGIEEGPPVPLGPLRYVAWAAAEKAYAVARRMPGVVGVAA